MFLKALPALLPALFPGGLLNGLDQLAALFHALG